MPDSDKGRYAIHAVGQSLYVIDTKKGCLWLLYDDCENAPLLIPALYFYPADADGIANEIKLARGAEDYSVYSDLSRFPENQ